MSSKIREALRQIEAYASSHGLWDIEVMAKTALAEPVLNCDVGTADEQNERFCRFCFNHRSLEKGCGDCPLLDKSNCEIYWAQMPYEEEEVGNEL